MHWVNTTDSTNAAIVDHAVSVRAQVGGHALIWGRGRGQTYPEEVAVQVEQSDTPEDTLKQLMDEHIRTVTNHFKGRVDVWDVVNEHLSSRINASRIDENIGSSQGTKAKTKSTRQKGKVP